MGVFDTIASKIAGRNITTQTIGSQRTIDNQLVQGNCKVLVDCAGGRMIRQALVEREKAQAETIMDSIKNEYNNLLSLMERLNSQTDTATLKSFNEGVKNFSEFVTKQVSRFDKQSKGDIPLQVPCKVVIKKDKTVERIDGTITKLKTEKKLIVIEFMLADKNKSGIEVDYKNLCIGGEEVASNARDCDLNKQAGGGSARIMTDTNRSYNTSSISICE